MQWYRVSLPPAVPPITLSISLATPERQSAVVQHLQPCGARQLLPRDADQGGLCAADERHALEISADLFGRNGDRVAKHQRPHDRVHLPAPHHATTHGSPKGLQMPPTAPPSSLLCALPALIPLMCPACPHPSNVPVGTHEGAWVLQIALTFHGSLEGPGLLKVAHYQYTRVQCARGPRTLQVAQSVGRREGSQCWGGGDYVLSRNRKKCGKMVVLCGKMW